MSIKYRFDLFKYIRATYCPLFVSIRNLYNPCKNACRYCGLSLWNGYRKKSLTSSISRKFTPYQAHIRLVSLILNENGQGERNSAKKRYFLAKKRILKYVGTECSGVDEITLGYLHSILVACGQLNLSMLLKVKDLRAFDFDSSYLSLLKETKSVVCVSFSTFDENMRLKLEPNSPTISYRMRVLEKLLKNEVKVVFALQPFIPEISFLGFRRYYSLIRSIPYHLVNLIHGTFNDYYPEPHRKYLKNKKIKRVISDRVFHSQYLLNTYTQAKEKLKSQFFFRYFSTSLPNAPTCRPLKLLPFSCCSRSDW